MLKKTTNKTRARRSSNKLDINSFEPLVVFRDVDMEIVINHDAFTKEQADEILDIVNIASKNIYIDKSYVAYEGTKYEKVLFKEDGWNEFKLLLLKTAYGSKCTKSQKSELSTVYQIMVLCYIYLFLEDYGYDSSNICLSIADGAKYTVEIYRDDTTSWKSYPGKWQTW